jgi:hypothetical protein
MMMTRQNSQGGSLKGRHMDTSDSNIETDGLAARRKMMMARQNSQGGSLKGRSMETDSDQDLDTDNPAARKKMMSRQNSLGGSLKGRRMDTFLEGEDDSSSMLDHNSRGGSVKAKGSFKIDLSPGSSKRKVMFNTPLVDPRPERNVPPTMRDDGTAGGDYDEEEDQGGGGGGGGHARARKQKRSFGRTVGSSVRRVVRSLCAVYFFVARRRDGF